MDMLFGTFASKSLFIIRVALGIIFFAHGAQKVFGWFGGPGLKGVIGYFRHARQAREPRPRLPGRPALTELLGGLAMIGGFLVRPAAVGLIIVMLVAIAKVHAPNGFFINWSLEPGKAHGFEMNLALIAMALGVLFGGAGLLSIHRR